LDASHQRRAHTSDAGRRSAPPQTGDALVFVHDRKPFVKTRTPNHAAIAPLRARSSQCIAYSPGASNE
jgi:hypothetical protein